MTKLEKVIYSLERCNCHVPDACRDCAYDDKPAPDCWQSLERDALELLKEREPVKPKEVKLWYIEYACGYCDYKSVGRKDGYKMRFCPCCGRAVKWDD